MKKKHIKYTIQLATLIIALATFISLMVIVDHLIKF
jgi:hypothetical protein